MADNIRLNQNTTDGSTLATAEVTFSGDTADVQIIGAGLMSGSAESYVMTFAQAGAGVVGIGVQRTTLASDDPAVTSLAIMDDWDESDRAKVNVIAGQAGIAAGTGVDGATVPRVTLATDVGLPAGTNALGSTTITAMVGQADANNSTTTPLAGDAVFTGTAVEILNFSHVMVNIFSDEASATDGLSIEWSSDATNWDNTDVFTIPANTSKTYSFPAVSRYYRVVYTNGSTIQTMLRLEAVLKVGSQASSSHRIADSIVGEDDAELIKAVLTGLAPDATYKNLLVTNAGEMKVSIENVNGVVLPVSQSGVWNITDISGTISLPTGASTATLQTTGNAILTTIDADTGSIKTSVELIDDTVTTLGTTTYVEATTKGLTIGAVRNDALAALADTDNEFAPLQVNNLGALWTTREPNLIDSGNSTTSNLGGGATFTGTGIDLLAYEGVTVTLFADQDGAADGMRFEFSSDNSNWDLSDQHDYLASTGREFQFTAQAQYFRVVFVNGATPQGAMRIQTILHKETVPSQTIHRLDDTLAPDRSSSVVKASIMAQAAGTGNFIPVDATAGGNLKISVEEIDGSATIAVTNAGTFVVQEDGAALTALQLIDDTVAVLGTATYAETTTKGNVMGVVRNDDLATLADTDNEIAPLQVDNQGALYVNQAAAENKQASGVAAGGAPGTDDMIAAVVGKKILVTAMSLTATSTTTNSVFIDNADNDLWANTANPIPLSMDADGDTLAGIVLQYNPAGWFKTDTVNEAVTLNSSAAQDIAWSISWIETD